MIQCAHVNKFLGKPSHQILFDINLTIKSGEFVSISGKSGSGKSTLLYLVSSLDAPTTGAISIDGIDLTRLNTDQIHEFRNKFTGFIFQFHFLLPELTALENVLLPARKAGVYQQSIPHAEALLEELGLKAHKHKLPSEMSGGEQQRVAIARALILKPKYIFADEPTGNLDSDNAAQVMRKLREVNKTGTSICLVTHDREFSKMADREILLRDGHLITG
jgi:putative ABC transport system ATP-binding protein/lipoprotein-releasing system ATP-binding protein